MNPERLTKDMFLNKFNSDTHRNKFYKIELCDVYQQQRICNLEAFKVKLKLQKNYLIHKPKLRQYVHFKWKWNLK